MSWSTADPGRPSHRDEPPLLKIQEATVVKNHTRVLDRINLTIREGEHTAILGPNGAGKSSLIRLIAHQDYPLAHPDGRALLLILGQKLWNVSKLRSQLGIVSADLQNSILTGTCRGGPGAWTRCCRASSRPTASSGTTGSPRPCRNRGARPWP